MLPCVFVSELNGSDGAQTEGVAEFPITRPTHWPVCAAASIALRPLETS